MAEQDGARADRRGAFLRALARSGSVTGAARAAGVWPRTVYVWRGRDAGFAAAWARALARARRALAAGRVPALADDEVVRASKTGRPRVARSGPVQWSTAREERFLEVLGGTANVSAACRAVGVSNAAVYQRRAGRPDFAAAWREALDHGWHRLEAALLFAATRAGAGGGAEGGAEDAPFAAMTVDQALTLFKMHRHGVTGAGARPRHDWRRREPTVEEVRAEVLRRVTALVGEREGE